MAFAPSDKPKIVVGLDFGTTYSGFAFAHRSDPEDLHLLQEWPNASRPYCKTQTILFYTAGDCVQPEWGWTALEKYTSALQSFRSGWLKEHGCPPDGEDMKREVGELFFSFKLLLAESSEVTPRSGLNGFYEAAKLIVDYLRCISAGHLKEKYGKTLSMIDVQWCLTVPAIWSERAKARMLKYAEMAGLAQGKYCSSIDASRYPVRIVLEPEAASFACQKQLRDCVSLNRGDKFLLADIGGGTIDIVVHEKAESTLECTRNVHEVRASSGDTGGGTFADRNFMEFLKKKIGCFERFKSQEPGTVHMIVQWWLGVRGKCSFDGTGSKFFEVPHKLSKAWRKHDEQLGIENPEEYYEEVEISSEQMKAIIDTELDKAIQLIYKALHPDVKYIFLVGGFSENKYLVQKIKAEFQGAVHHVIAPPNPGAAICKGAVAIGFGTGVVLSRISKRWYGKPTSRPFRQMDPLSYKFIDDDGVERCRKVFSLFVAKGESIEESESVTHSYSPVYHKQKRMAIKLYSSSSGIAPTYVTDPGCELMASFSLDRNEDLHLDKDREVEVSMYFGRASIEVSARRVNFGSNRKPEKLYSVEFNASSKYMNK